MGLLDRCFGALTGGYAGQKQLRVTLDQREAALSCLTRLVCELEYSRCPMTKGLRSADLAARLRVGIAPRPHAHPDRGCEHGYDFAEDCVVCVRADSAARTHNLMAAREAAFAALSRAGHDGPQCMSELIDALAAERDQARAAPKA